MDMRFYEAILDPVIVIEDSGQIQYVNSAGMRWLAVPPDIGVVGKSIDNFVVFEGSSMFSTADNLGLFAFTPYQIAHFELPARSYKSMAKVALQKIPNPKGGELYTIIVREKAFILTLFDDENLKLNSSTLQSETSAAEEKPPEGYNAEGVAGDQHFLDELTITRALPHERTALHHTRVTVFVMETKVNTVGQSTIITEDWIELTVKSGALKDGAKCSIEVNGTPELKAFSTSAQVIKIRSDARDLEHVRLSFGNLGPMAKKSLDEFLIKFALKI